MSRKYDAIDLMKLRAMGSTNGWNEQLTNYYKRRDINGLAVLAYRIQAGMDDLAKAKLNTEEINAWFCRLSKSIENTAKKIIKEKHPLPIDNPLTAKDNQGFYDAKKRRERELMAFLRKAAY